MRAAERRCVCISVHDVAPGTWPACERLLQLIDGFGPVPVTLLVVPDYHHRGSIERFPAFLAAIENRLARGDEVALHGYFHLDESAAPRNPAEWVRRRLLTRSEGEFAALSGDEARRRVEQGMQLMRSLGWPVQGFVAPGWLIGKGARSALADSPFCYTTTRLGIYRLPEWKFTAAPSLVYSVGAPWRHRMSESLNRVILARSGAGPARASLHPVDAGLPDAVAHWRSVIPRLLEDRTPVTKAQWALEQTGGLPA